MTKKQMIIVFLLCFAAVGFFAYHLVKREEITPSPSPVSTATPSAESSK
ncbi:hypothetical protein [Cohnella sp. WQ 127256]|nr:hypothetical protein [Cohnella sp. WQ 127256]